ncbi:MAG: hypothetical protein ACRDRF_00640 [Pseudonocardiaceae bacterium]
MASLVKSWRISGAGILIEWMGGILTDGILGGILSTLTYGPNIAVNLALGNAFVVSITDAVAFQTDNPTNPPPTGFNTWLFITYKNVSGGAHGAGTFGTLYKTSAALAAIADTKNRTIAFQWNGTNYVEMWRTAADVAN